MLGLRAASSDLADGICMAGAPARVRSRAAPSSAFRALDGEATRALHGVHLVRVPTVGPIMNENWFLEQIQLCEEAFAAAGPTYSSA